MIKTTPSAEPLSCSVKGDIFLQQSHFLTRFCVKQEKNTKGEYIPKSEDIISFPSEGREDRN